MSNPLITRILDAHERNAVHVSDLLGDLVRLLTLWIARASPVLLVFFLLFKGEVILRSIF